MNRVMLLIPTIPARVENFLSLIEDVRKQTREPERVVVFLNGWNIPRDAVDAALATLTCDTEVHLSEAPCGPGIRWTYLSTHWTDGDIAVTLDDDFRIDPTFIEQTLSALRPSVSMVAWTGHPSHRKYLDLHNTVRFPESLWIGGTGAAATRVSAIAGIHTHPLADECFGLHGDEELLVSLWIWQHHGKIVRPAGTPPLRHVEALQYAPTASHKQHGQVWHRRRQDVIDAYEWYLTR
jgi:hypothetical protein